MASKNLSRVYQRLVDSVYTDDLESQRYYLSMVEEHRHIPVNYLLERGCLFIPNNEYISHYLGRDAYSYGCELYRYENCQWTLFVIIPILDLAEDVVGLVGWDAHNKYLEVSEGQLGLPMYKVSSKNVFDREKYFLSDVSLLRRTFKHRVLIVVDGVFDSIALNYRGIPAISLLGSTFSRELLYFMRWYDYIYVALDNDAAGVKLYQRLKSSLPRVFRIIQNKAKDVEELLRGEEPDGEVIKILGDIIQNPRPKDYYLS